MKLIHRAREGGLWGDSQGLGKGSIANGQGLGHQSLSEGGGGGVCKLGTVVRRPDWGSASLVGGYDLPAPPPPSHRCPLCPLMPFKRQSTAPGTVGAQALCESTQGPGLLPVGATFTYPRPKLCSGGSGTFPGFLAPTPLIRPMPQLYLLAALEEVLLSHPHMTSPTLAFPLLQQNEIPRLPLAPREGLDASAVSSLGQRIRTPGFHCWLPHCLRMEEH